VLVKRENLVIGEFMSFRPRDHDRRIWPAGFESQATNVWRDLGNECCGRKRLSQVRSDLHSCDYRFLRALTMVSAGERQAVSEWTV
jgi:hypothetical protein